MNSQELTRTHKCAPKYMTWKVFTSRGQMKRSLQAFLIMSAGLMFLVGQVNAQYYDLSVGTERHFYNC